MFKYFEYLNISLYVLQACSKCVNYTWKVEMSKLLQER